MTRSPLLLLAVFCVQGCGAATGYKQTGSVYPARGPNCEFQVLRDPVLEPYEEIGVIEVEAFHAKAVPNSDSDFHKVVAFKVCKAGGHAVIPAINNRGRYILGRVIRFQPRQCDDCEEKERSVDEYLEVLEDLSWNLIKTSPAPYEVSSC